MSFFGCGGSFDTPDPEVKGNINFTYTYYSRVNRHTMIGGIMRPLRLMPLSSPGLFMTPSASLLHQHNAIYNINAKKHDSNVNNQILSLMFRDM